VSDVHSRPYDAVPVHSPDYSSAVPGKPYGDNYAPPPSVDVDGIPRRLRYVSASLLQYRTIV